MWSHNISLGFQAKNGAHGISYQHAGIEYQNNKQNKVNSESISNERNSEIKKKRHFFSNDRTKTIIHNAPIILQVVAVLDYQKSTQQPN